MKKEDKRLVLSLIDKGTWQHSWHLTKNTYGYTDWSNKENIKKCSDIASGYQQEAMELLELAGKVSTLLIGEHAKIETQERIDVGLE